MSVLGSESGLMSSFLSSEEIGELLDKVQNMFSVYILQVCWSWIPALPATLEHTVDKL